jgi:cysteine desulfurase
VGHILNLSFEGVEGESLLDGLSDLAVSSGSACNSATREPSYVLRALGRSDAEAQASLRFSLGRFSTESEVQAAVAAVTREVTRLRELSPASVAASGDDEARDRRTVGEAGSIAAGTWVRFAIACDGERVTNARYKVYGCPHTMAAAAWFAEKMRGQRLEDVLTGGVQAAAQALQLPVETTAPGDQDACGTASGGHRAR